jgi:hypothetical protein
MDVGLDEAAEHQASLGVLAWHIGDDRRSDLGDKAVAYADVHRPGAMGKPRIGDNEIEGHSAYRSFMEL